MGERGEGLIEFAYFAGFWYNLGIMDIQDKKNNPNYKYPEFVTPNDSIKSGVEAEQPEQIQASETADLETVRGAALEQPAPSVVTPDLAARPTEAMTAKELTDLGLDASMAAAATPDREKVLLNALIETKLDAGSGQVGTQLNELQDLAFGPDGKKE